jgi:hypothetical protein
MIPTHGGIFNAPAWAWRVSDPSPHQTTNPDEGDHEPTYHQKQAPCWRGTLQQKHASQAEHVQGTGEENRTEGETPGSQAGGGNPVGTSHLGKTGHTQKRHGVRELEICSY